MTPTDRQKIAHELAQREAYMQAIRLHGPEHFLKPLRFGYRVTDWDGHILLEIPRKKKVALAKVTALADACAKRISELRARETMAAMDEEVAGVSLEERTAGAKAQAEAGQTKRWRRSA